MSDAPAPQTVIRPRKRHNKSRNGCVQCKQRKVKCDEVKPICGKCEGYRTDCSFLLTNPLRKSQLPLGPTSNAVSSASSTVVAGSSNLVSEDSRQDVVSTFSPASHNPQKFSILDLELLHSWSHGGAAAFMPCTGKDLHTFEVIMVQLAFKHQFLMYQILSIAALYLAHIHPEKASVYRHSADNHAATALAMFQPEISNLNSENCHACFAFSSTLFLRAWATQDLDKPSTIFFPESKPNPTSAVSIQWIKLHIGSMALLETSFPALRDGPLHTMFDPWMGLDKERDDPVEDDVRSHLDHLDLAWLNGPRTDEEKEVLSRAAGSVRRTFSMLSFNREINPVAVLMAWFAWCKRLFWKMLEEKVPEALLVVVYYCVAMKRGEYVFWIKGRPENLLRTILDVLPEGWERWTKWPIEVVFGKDTGDGTTSI